MAHLSSSEAELPARQADRGHQVRIEPGHRVDGFQVLRNRRPGRSLDAVAGPAEFNPPWVEGILDV